VLRRPIAKKQVKGRHEVAVALLGLSRGERIARPHRYLKRGAGVPKGFGTVSVPIAVGNQEKRRSEKIGQLRAVINFSPRAVIRARRVGADTVAMQQGGTDGGVIMMRPEEFKKLTSTMK